MLSEAKSVLLYAGNMLILLQTLLGMDHLLQINYENIEIICFARDYKQWLEDLIGNLLNIFF